jgi:hypothetical protein
VDVKTFFPRTVTCVSDECVSTIKGVSIRGLLSSCFFDGTMSSNQLRQKSAFSGTHSAHDAVLTIDQLNRISKHRYNANGQSILEPYMQVCT